MRVRCMAVSGALAWLILVGVALLSRPAFARAAPSAGTSPGVTVAEFENPLGQGDIGGAFGSSVLIAADGDIALIDGADASVPKAGEKGYLYEKTNGTWDTSPSHVFASSSSTHGLAAIALSADGATAAFLVSPSDGVVIFDQVDHVWSSAPVAELSYASDKATAAISADGSELLLGNPYATVNGVPNEGAAYLYEKINGAWASTPVATFLDPAPQIVSGQGSTTSESHFGVVALSADGNTVLIGDRSDGGIGRAYLYEIQTGANWPEDPVPAAVIEAPSSQSADGFGINVALSSDGNDAFVQNNPLTSSPVPSVYLFDKQGGTWSTAPVRSFALPSDYYSVPGFAISGDGSVMMTEAGLGLSSGPNCCQVVLVYTRLNGIWTTEPVNRLAEPDELALASPYNNDFGSVFFHFQGQISYDGSEALIGDTQSPSASPPPPNQIPTYGGPGVAYAFETTDDWQTPYTGGGTPPSPPPSGSDGGGGGTFGGWALLGLLLVVGARRYRHS